MYTRERGNAVPFNNKKEEEEANERGETHLFRNHTLAALRQVYLHLLLCLCVYF
jgi:hypothetical protein